MGSYNPFLLVIYYILRDLENVLAPSLNLTLTDSTHEISQTETSREKKNKLIYLYLERLRMIVCDFRDTETIRPPA